MRGGSKIHAIFDPLSLLKVKIRLFNIREQKNKSLRLLRLS